MNRRDFLATWAVAAAASRALGAPSPARSPVSWKELDGVRLPIPPSEHPRLFLRAPDVAQLPARLAAPALQPVVQRLQDAARRSPQHALQWQALQYLIEPDRAAGRATVEQGLALLRQVELPDQQDACRFTGRWMCTGAILYDWLHELLTPAEQVAFREELVRLAKTQETGYPPTRQGSVTGHASEAQIMREMIAAGIALYDEFPEMYDLAAGRFFAAHLPARNWLYDGHAYHQGDSYGPYRYSWDTFPLFIFDRLGAGNIYNPEQRFVPYWYLYATRPDGQRLRAGDTYAVSAARGKPWGVGLGACLTASYYGDGYLLGEHLRQGGVGDGEALFELLWRDPDLEPQSPESLPLTYYAPPPFGWLIARTGWDRNAVICELKVNVYNFCNHQHLDAGAFQIYHRGALAIDSGFYDKYGTPHGKGYYWRTVAHNCLLVHDPAEELPEGWVNDGGQRLPNRRSEPRDLPYLLAPEHGYRTGEVLGQGVGPDPARPTWTWLQGDLTAAYSAKVKRVVRSAVFLNLGEAAVPAALIVHDQVTAADPQFRKSWLLHTQEEPRLAAAGAVVECSAHDEDGRLLLDVLLPAADNLALETIGGPGREFWAGGQNHPADVDPARLARGSHEPGAWRIEVSPRRAAAEDTFLTVMQVTSRATAGRLPVRLLDADTAVGCVLESGETSWVVLFQRRAGRSAEPVRWTVPGTGRCRCLVTGLAAGSWRATRAGDGETLPVTVTAAAGAAWIEGPAGSWTLAR